MSSSLTSMLNNDLLLEIFEWFDNDALYRNLLSITLVCKDWHALAQGILDHTLNLVIAKAFEARNLKLFCRLWYDSSFRSRVKRIHVREWHHDRLETFKETQPNGGTGYYYSTLYEPPSQNWHNTSKQIITLTKTLERVSLVFFRWSAVPPMPRQLAVVLAAQQDCAIAISRNPNAVDAAGWSFTPLSNHNSLQTATLFNARSTSISNLDFLVLADDHGILSSVGRIVSSSPSLRSLKIRAIATTPPFARGRLRISQKVLVKGLAWLYDPLRRAGMCLRLAELELTNICVCGTEYSPLNEMIDTDVLRSLKLSCMQLLLHDGLQLPGLQKLRLRFKSGRASRISQCTTEWPRETISTTMLGFTGLKVLEIFERVDILTELVLRTLGPRLVTLLAVCRIPHETRLFGPESAIESAWLDGYPSSFIESLGAFCPNLTELSVTVPGTTQRFTAVLSSIATFLPQLSVLHLYRQVEPFHRVSGENTLQSYGFPNECIRPIWRKLQGSTAHKILELHLHLLDGKTSEASRTFAPFRDQCSPLRTIVARRVVDERPRSQQNIRIFIAELEDVNRAIKQGEPDASGRRIHWSHKKEVLERLAKYGVNTHFQTNRSGGLVEDPQVPPQEFLDTIR